MWLFLLPIKDWFSCPTTGWHVTSNIKVKNKSVEGHGDGDDEKLFKMNKKMKKGNDTTYFSLSRSWRALVKK